jgi:hypothetical protein
MWFQQTIFLQVILGKKIILNFYLSTKPIYFLAKLSPFNKTFIFSWLNLFLTWLNLYVLIKLLYFLGKTLFLSKTSISSGSIFAFY